jgi:hypothetical protein
MKKHFYFFHLIDRDIQLDENGLVSPQYMYDSGNFQGFDKSMKKYFDRITGGWGIYPGKKSLTKEEFTIAIKKFRDSESALSWIYFFRFPPYLTLGKSMKKSISHKRVMRIDLLDLEKKKIIKEIDWGRWMSHSDNKPLSREFYGNLTPEEYFSVFDDNHTPLFATLNHISICPIKGYIPKDFLEEYSVPKTLSKVKELLL